MILASVVLNCFSNCFQVSNDYANVVVLGGVASSCELSDTETFSFDGSPDCSSPASMPNPLKEMAVGYFENKLWFAGGSGEEGQAYFSSSYYFDGTGWTAGPDMISARAFAGSTDSPQVSLTELSV